MRGFIKEYNNGLLWQYQDEKMFIQPFSENSLRVRITKLNEIPQINWAFIDDIYIPSSIINISDNEASITNGNIKAVIDKYAFVTFYNEKNEVLLKELWETRLNEEHHLSTENFARVLTPHYMGNYSAEMTFEANKGEKIYGLGQRQIDELDMKGCELELLQKNSQANIPFYISNKGYGFYWNNPGVGRAVFAKNLTKFTCKSTKLIDYFITAGNSPKEIIKQYTSVTGRSTKMPNWATGFWQCKLRYRTQEEVLAVARSYKERNLPISVIVIDFFHWPQQGEWKFDEKYFPNPKKMVDELNAMGIELVVSVWPTVDPRSSNYAEMKAKNLLVRSDMGVSTNQTILGAEVFADVTNPETQKFMWEKAKENYFKYGIKSFWLDEAEPEYTKFDMELYRYYKGPALECTNIYPMNYSKAYFDGLREAGVETPINLVRCAFAGSQRYGALLWSGDIHSNFKTLSTQVKAGLNAGMSGIPWWTSDIGGFFGGDPKSDYFRELVVRWFQFGLFCPVFRLHGHRIPTGEGSEGEDTGLFDFNTCGPNEVWEFGDRAYEIIKKLMFFREKLRPYISKVLDESSENGSPALRTVFYNYPQNPKYWDIEHEFMLGEDILVAPIVNEGQTEITVILPDEDTWIDYNTGKEVCGEFTYYAPLEITPIFIRKASDLYKKLS